MTEEDNQDLYLEIDDVSYSRILELSKQGDDYGKRKEFSKAIDSYYEALNLVPDPKEDYSATTWLLTAIGESYLFLKDYENARNVGASTFGRNGDWKSRLHKRSPPARTL
ncbi:MAG: hypothetical protein SWZ49_07115 [Cyanobacteriota bacterium]|nr:hypothetical protein [Cyanobacteriota bacterium]